MGNYNPERLLIVAHRGASNIAPENTLKAFQKAIDLKADYIEFDVHKTKDEEIVIMHDGNTFRTTGHYGFIKNMNLEELKKLDCGEGETIPTLQELINLAIGKIKLNCEIKSRGIGEKIIRIIHEADILDTTIISSFKHDILLKIQKIEPQIKLASLEPTRTGWINSWLTRKKLFSIANQNGFYAINPLYKLVNPQFVLKAHKNGIKVFPWTVNSANNIKKLMEMGVDGIITNDIFTVKKILNDSY